MRRLYEQHDWDIETVNGNMLPTAKETKFWYTSSYLKWRKSTLICDSFNEDQRECHAKYLKLTHRENCIKLTFRRNMLRRKRESIYPQCVTLLLWPLILWLDLRYKYFFRAYLFKLRSTYGTYLKYEEGNICQGQRDTCFCLRITLI